MDRRWVWIKGTQIVKQRNIAGYEWLDYKKSHRKGAGLELKEHK